MFSRLMLLLLCLWQAQKHAYASPVPVIRTVARAARSDMWTARDLVWNCTDDGYSCTYDFLIGETAADEYGLNHARCYFTIRSEDGEPVIKSSFSNKPCEQSTQYLYGGSWGSNGYFVLTVDNVRDNMRAYFGYSDDETTSGQTLSAHYSLGYMVNDDALREKAGRMSVQATEPTTGEKDTRREAESRSEDSLTDIAMSGEVADIYSKSSFDTTTEDLSKGKVSDKHGLYNTARQLDGDADKLSTGFGESDTISHDILGDHTTKLSANPVDACPVDSAEVTSDRNADVPKPGNLPSDGSGPNVPSSAVTWSIRNTTRSVQYKPNNVHVDFLIDVLPSGPVDVPCTIQVDFKNSTDPAFASWYVEPCRESGWYFSWGYNAADDSAVATLISPDRSEAAWFGWEKVNSNLPGAILSDVGPSIVQTYDC